jgi:two-component system, OmpR family, alkaline phosphatase synthesis response regulator PhoP
MAGETILLVDDEANIVQLARLYLEREGFKVISVGDGPGALEKVLAFRPALMVLDIMLPGLDGIEVCRRLRAEKDPVSILMLTARDDDIDKILGLEMGADDYMTKPFNPRELVARVKAVLRRSLQPPANQPANGFNIGDLNIDPSSREVHCKEVLLDLRTQEFEVLMVLARHRGQVLSREQLLSQAWGFDFAGQTRTVDVHIAQLRRKLSASSVRIETITGVGYKLVV